MSAEADFIAALRPLAGEAARGLFDDATVLPIGACQLVLTKDMLVEGVHYLPGDPPGDVAWKLLAVNLSDLAGKGARPIGILLGYMLAGESWDQRFVAGLDRAMDYFQVALLGGDTVRGDMGTPRVLSLTAIGKVPSLRPVLQNLVPARAGARSSDDLWVSGSIGDAGAGLAILQGALTGDDALVRRYRRPEPRLAAGQALAPLVSAMMDVSDGLLIDASRLAQASCVAALINLESVPLSPAYRAARGEDQAARLLAVTAGDDYELLFTASPEAAPRILTLADQLDLPLTRIGRIGAGSGLQLRDAGTPIPLPERLGYEHGTG